GIIGLETFLPICIKGLIEPGVLSWPKMLEKMTINPARVLGIDRGTLKAGAVADVTVIDPNAEWTIDPNQFRSKSRNCPFAGWRVRGRAVWVLVGGEVKVGPAAACAGCVTDGREPVPSAEYSVLPRGPPPPRAAKMGCQLPPTPLKS